MVWSEKYFYGFYWKLFVKSSQSIKQSSYFKPPSLLADKNLSSFDVLEVSTLDKVYNCILYGSHVIEPLGQIISELLVADLPTDGHLPLDSVLDAHDELGDLSGNFDAGVKAGVNGVEGGDLEDPVGLADMLGMDVGVELHLGESLGETDDGLELTDCDGDVVALLVGVALNLGPLPVLDVKIVKLLSGLLGEPGRDPGPGVGDVLLEGQEVDLVLAFGLHHVALV